MELLPVELIEHIASAGSLNRLQYACEHGCPWDENTSTKPYLVDDSPLCLQYALQNGCPIQPHLLEWIEKIKMNMV